MIALALDPEPQPPPTHEPTTHDQLVLARLERKIDRNTELLEKVVKAQEALERRIEQFIDPAMDIQGTLHGIGEIVARINAATQAQGKMLTQRDSRLADFTRTIEAVVALYVGFDNDPARQAQT